MAAGSLAGMLLTVTETAKDKILELRSQEEEPDGLGLRIEVTGVRGVDYTYDLTFDPIDEADVDAGDVVEKVGELPVIIPSESIDALRGATLDLPATSSQAGLVLRNPNRPDPLSGSHMELSGTPAEKIQQLLEGQINPALASHGGYATLDRVEGEIAYVTMGGGCQGCAVSAMTLRDGIARSIIEAVPEITEVSDVTDHTQGENPYYA
jgi:Fe/S biogenesis protein NfuA